MALTDEQYQQMFCYVDDDEMVPDERNVFEAALADNMELREEVEFYKQVRLLAESVEEQIRNINTFPTEEKNSGTEETWVMLTDSRKKWENQYEHELKLKHGIKDSANIPAGTLKSKIRSIRISSWLMAASLAGLISLGFFWLYYKSNKEDSKAYINEKATDSSVITNSQAEDRVGNVIQIQPTLPPENASSKDIVEKKEQEKQSALFASNFSPDAAPPDKEGSLESAFTFYENKQYQQASREFETADFGPLTRGLDDDHQKLAVFYIHYYKALSYLAADIKTSKAISELRISITRSPDSAWKTKARWYLALAYLKNGNTQAATNYLEQIADSQASNGLKQKAISLMNMLRK